MANLEQATEGLRLCLEQQLGILKSLIKESFSDKKLNSLRILPASACSTGAAICDLGKHPEYYLAEMTMLARSFIEKVTNYCYLLLCDEEEYKNYVTHPYYRMFHNLDRTKVAGKTKIGLRFQGKDRIKDLPQVVEALSRFSDTNPKRNWSDKTIDQKISLIHEKSGIKIEFFLMNTLTIYSNASEALHGSLYGSAFHLGTFEPGGYPTNLEWVYKKVSKESALLFAQMSSMIVETLKLIHTLHPIEEMLKKSKLIEDQTLVLMKSAFEQ
ncbi:MAG: DUF5677 domain-containing protein [bacterium]|nr:DUF5677 domain-containing protein [bacterium]